MDIVDKKYFSYKGLSIFVATIVIVLVASLISVYIMKFGGPIPIESLGTFEQFGAFGDFIGGLVNPLLQLIVITMLLWSIQVQRKELSTSNETLIATKYELTESRKANEQSAIALESQAKFQRTQLELTTLETLLFRYKIEKIHDFDIDMFIVDDTSNEYEKFTKTSFESIIKAFRKGNSTDISSITFDEDSNKDSYPFYNSIHINLERQLYLLEKYTEENGSRYFVENWFQENIWYFVFFQKILAQGQWSCIVHLRNSLKKIEQHFKNNGVDFSSVRNEYKYLNLL